MMGVTLYDICKHTGLSTATVSRVINDNPHVLDSTRKRVKDAMRELDYYPTHAARTLKRKQTDTIGVIFPDIANGYFAEVLRGIHRVTRACNRQLQLTFYDSDECSLQVLQRYMMERRGDAVIFFNPSSAAQELCRMKKLPIPVILLGCPVKGPHFCSVELDNRNGVRQVLQHILSEGCRDIAVLAGPAGGYDTDQRLVAAREYLKEQGLELSTDRIWTAGYSLASGREAVEAYMQTGQALPDAVFGLNDSMALGALQALQEHNVSVPGEMAVAGFDDTDVAHYAGLTTVRIPTEDMGAKACEMVMSVLESEKPLPAAERCAVIETTLIVRGSSRHQSQ